jgi:hypothetical protein
MSLSFEHGKPQEGVMDNLYWVTYDDQNGDVVPDGKVRQYVDDFLKGPTRKCTVGSSLLIDEFRMLVARGLVAGNQIRVHFDGAWHPINAYAVLVQCPQDLSLHYASELLQFSMKKQRAERDSIHC